MSNVYLQDTTLTAIGNAIREKSGKTDLIFPKDMPSEISNLHISTQDELYKIVLGEVS